MLIIHKRTLLFFLLLLIVLGFIVFKFKIKEETVQTNTTQKPYVAIVIDDLGNNGEGTDDLVKLDIPITAAVMPFLEYSEIDAKKAYDANMEIILHLPMEPEKGIPSWLGPRAIRSSYCNEEVRSIVEDALDQLKWAKGINNHMGSKIMKDENVMKEILKVAKEKELYFLNSKTSESTVAEELSKELEIVYFCRNIFLDNEKTDHYISKAMEDLGKAAKEKGYAIGIGHVGGQGGKITVEVIDKMSKKLKEQGIEFIYLSQMKDILVNN